VFGKVNQNKISLFLVATSSGAARVIRRIDIDTKNLDTSQLEEVLKEVQELTQGEPKPSSSIEFKSS